MAQQMANEQMANDSQVDQEAATPGQGSHFDHRYQRDVDGGGSFTGAGQLPPVGTGTAPPAPTASELAYDDANKDGGGGGGGGGDSGGSSGGDSG